MQRVGALSENVRRGEAGGKKITNNGLVVTTTLAKTNNHAWQSNNNHHKEIVIHGQTEASYPARLEDETVHLVTDLGREAAFQQLKNKHTNG